MAANPNPDFITDEMWYLWEELHKLEPTSQLGGIYANKSGYHNTRNGNASNNYSVVDNEDKGGPGNKAAALDWTFPNAQSGDYDKIIKYSKRLLKSGQDANDSRLDGWREFYGQADQDTHVEGWDFRYAVPATSDPSHLWHIHFSCDRDKVTSKANMDKLLEVLRGGDDQMTDQDIARGAWRTDGQIRNEYFSWRVDSPAHEPPGTNEFIMGETAIMEAANQAYEAHLKACANAEAIAEVKALVEELKEMIVTMPGGGTFTATGEITLTPAEPGPGG